MVSYPADLIACICTIAAIRKQVFDLESLFLILFYSLSIHSILLLEFGHLYFCVYFITVENDSKKLLVLISLQLRQVRYF